MCLRLELLREAGGRTELGESPVWDAATGDLWWVDIDGCKLLRQPEGSGRIETWPTPEIPGFVVLTGPERPAVGMQSGIFAFEPGTSSFERRIGLDRPGHRFNDATVDRDGRLWASTMTLDAKPQTACIHVVTETLTLEPVVEGLTIPNGLAVDLDHGRLFYSDSHPDAQGIWSRPVGPGSAALGEPLLFATTFDLGGRPDGAALDQRGNYWIAGVDGAELYIFDRAGRLDATLALPFPAPTKLCFGGASGRRIAITSKAIGDDGGYLAMADLPEAFAPGITQPYWSIAAG